jgi:ABC-type glycerol-3-phosphate transport system permease component
MVLDLAGIPIHILTTIMVNFAQFGSVKKGIEESIKPQFNNRALIGMLISTGIIQNLPEDQIEAARIDGANKWQIFKSITFPQDHRLLIDK